MSATFRLPPSERDFEVFFDWLDSVSTRQSAERHGISQTRVRQLRVLVADWLAEMLPEMSETDLKKQARLAQHMAAARLEHQHEQAMRFWTNGFDPKHLRQATRIALAMARLGVVPGRLHALAGDALEGSADLGESRTEQCEEPRDDGFPASGKRELPDSAVSPQSQNYREADASRSPSTPHAYPSKEDCSPNRAAASQQPSDEQIREEAVQLEGARIMESRLLTLIAEQEGNHQKVAHLNETLTRVRHEMAEMEVRLAPYIVGAEVETAGHQPAAPARENRAVTPFTLAGTSG